MKKQCGNCQYFRDGSWCSNSESGHSLTSVTKTDNCEKFSLRGKKAPFAMRLTIEVLRKLQGKK